MIRPGIFFNSNAAIDIPDPSTKPKIINPTKALESKSPTMN